MKLYIFLSALLITQSSCKFYGLTNDREILSTEQKSTIKKHDKSTMPQAGYIYEINGAVLREQIAKCDSALVYLFVNGCPSDHCKPLSAYQQYAETNNYKLFLVMVGYYRLNETLAQKPTTALYAIDYDTYESPKSKVVIPYFRNEIQGLPQTNKSGEYQGSLYFFRNGDLQRILKDLPAD